MGKVSIAKWFPAFKVLDASILVSTSMYGALYCVWIVLPAGWTATLSRQASGLHAAAQSCAQAPNHFRGPGPSAIPSPDQQEEVAQCPA